VDPGLRYAITTVTRYFIFLIGLLVSAGIIGLSWSKVQWIAAAITVGLGFGLQEIFANFVSGLILLFERPIRIGDLVTIGDKNGYVTNIQMRATTVRDWNRREIVVPNKELVTGRVINWTLSDSTYRVDQKIGVAYGSDTALVREILLRIATEHSKIIEKPKPKAIFLGFGDSALEFELRYHIPHMDLWPTILTDVNMAVDTAFREAGIFIAFPQRDIHIRSINGLDGTRLAGSGVAITASDKGGGQQVMESSRTAP